MRLTGSLLLGAYLVSIADPVLANVRKGEAMAALQQAPEQGATEQLAQQLTALEELLERLQRRLDGRFEFDWQSVLAASDRSQPPPPARRAELAAQEAELASLAGAIGTLLPQARSELAALDGLSRQADLPPDVLLRQAGNRMSFEEGAARLNRDLAALRVPADDAAFAQTVRSALDWLRGHSSRKTAAPFDPDKLAFGSRHAPVRAPATGRAELDRIFGGSVAPAADWQPPAARKAAPGAADLAPTEDVQLSAAIRTRAQQLGGTPLALLRFVHDSVRFVPSYGSVQGSDYTLQTLRGNAFDQASLLIALLRASNHPARYAYGTVDIPVDQAMNWVGGVTTPIAALSLLSQGGIPCTGLTQGGVITHIRLEHVWVEVWANPFPGGGVRGGTADSWVALDPSFKQHVFSAGMDLASAVPFDATAFAAHVTATAMTNAAEGWAQGVDHAYAAAQMSDYAQRVQTFIDDQGGTPSVGDVLGTSQVVAANWRTLPTGLPYRRVAEAASSSALADGLRWRFRLAIGDGSVFGPPDPDTLLVDKGLPSLAGRALALSATPASAADEQILRSYLPPAGGDPAVPPAVLPANLVQLAVHFSIDGHPVASGPARGFGAELVTRKGFFMPGRGWEETDNPFTVGDYQAVGLNLHGVSTAQAEKQKAQLDATRQKLQNQQFDQLSSHQLTGAILQSALMEYFIQNDTTMSMSSRVRNVVSYTQPSYGTLSTDSDVASLFGVPRLVRPGSVVIDMDRMSNTGAHKDGNPAATINYQEEAGRSLSGMEHKVLENAFSTPQDTVQGVSAVKLLALANMQGQRIYTITETNASTALAAVSLPASIERNIAEAATAGKIVRVHAAPMTYAQQTQLVGYSVLDPETGGGYFISTDNANGGEVMLDREGLGAVLVIIGLLFLLVAVLGGGLSFLLLIPALWLLGCGFSMLLNDDRPFDVANWIVGILIALLIWALPLGIGAMVAAALLELFIILANIDDRCAAGPSATKRAASGRRSAACVSPPSRPPLWEPPGLGALAAI